MKHCNTCGRDLEPSQFYNDKSKKDCLSTQCKGCIKARTKQYRLNNLEEAIARNTLWAQRNRKRSNEIKRNSRQKARQQCIDFYGGSCACCGITKAEFLVIDHIEGGGGQHRRKVGGGNQFYYWLKRNDYPAGFRVLCHNCNMALGVFGCCPHHQEVIREEKHVRLRKEVFTHYGTKCVCGEDTHEFLCIDHINNNGNAERRVLGSGIRFYYWLRRSGFPAGYRTLCANCNAARFLYGLEPRKFSHLRLAV